MLDTIRAENSDAFELLKGSLENVAVALRRQVTAMLDEQYRQAIFWFCPYNLKRTMIKYGGELSKQTIKELATDDVWLAQNRPEMGQERPERVISRRWVDINDWVEHVGTAHHPKQWPELGAGVLAADCLPAGRGPAQALDPRRPQRHRRAAGGVRYEAAPAAAADYHPEAYTPQAGAPQGVSGGATGEAGKCRVYPGQALYPLRGVEGRGKKLVYFGVVVRPGRGAEPNLRRPAAGTGQRASPSALVHRLLPHPVRPALGRTARASEAAVDEARIEAVRQDSKTRFGRPPEPSTPSTPSTGAARAGTARSHPLAGTTPMRKSPDMVDPSAGNQHRKFLPSSYRILDVFSSTSSSMTTTVLTGKKHPPQLVGQADMAILLAVERLHYPPAAQLSRLLYPNCHDHDRYARRRLSRLAQAGLLLRLSGMPTPGTAQPRKCSPSARVVGPCSG